MQFRAFFCISALISLSVEQAFSQFHLKEPSTSFEMPKELLEISGLDFINENNLACEQDETGVIFIYNLQDKKIIKQIPFGLKGDYEDISIVGKNAYVMDSRGIIYEILNFESEKKEIKKYNFSAANESNAEAMCSDVKNNRLLISFKESNGPKIKQKSVYAFDLSNHKMDETPVITISLDNILEQMNKEKKKGEKKIKSTQGINKIFSPSCMAVNPKDGNFYLISSHNRILIITNDKGIVLKSHILPKSLFTQPEGIAFSKSGDLYISNEGNKTKGNILKFNYAQ